MNQKLSVLRCVVVASLSAGAALVLSSCAAVKYPGSPSGHSDSRYVPQAGASSEMASRKRDSERPGLGTKAGSERYDSVQRTTFYRRSASPDAVAAFHYNDETGAKAMADLLGGGSKRGGLFEVAGGRLRVGLVDWSGDAYPRLEAGSRRIVMGHPGQDYSIRVENRSANRVEVVLSVDSLNVLTGAVASPTQSGYVIEPKGSVVVRGFRVNDSRVKSFEFSSVAASAAAGRGQARNVGVVGIAMFEEDTAKKLMKLREEQFHRDDASAFPVQSR